MMEKSGNRGEWSEFYAFMKILGEGLLYAADSDLNENRNGSYDVINIVRNEEVGKLIFCLDKNKSTVSMYLDGEEKPKIQIPCQKFQAQSLLLLNEIQNSASHSFEVPIIEEFRKQIMCKKIKTPLNDKTDIILTMHDQNANVTLTQGFSIKSQLGRPSTLLNAGRNTNFVYEISGMNDDKYMNEMNSLFASDGSISVRDRMQYILSHQFTLVYKSVDSVIFFNNLLLIDSNLPEIISQLLLEYYLYGINNIKDAVKAVGKANPLHYDQQNNHPFYEYKIKRFLVDVALGMFPNRTWNGNEEANGGYIVVKNDGGGCLLSFVS